ncbi:MAG: 4Fe-4S dicluster domain-containing protein [Candidatus Ranarchaeia archaeon]
MMTTPKNAGSVTRRWSAKPETSCRMTRSDVRNGLMIIINIDWCKGCGYCVEFCPADVLEVSPNVNMRGAHFPVVVSPEKCTTCQQCEYRCPDLAIYLVSQNAAPGPMLPTTTRKMEIESSTNVRDDGTRDG